MKKKLLAVLLALAMIFVLVACGTATTTTEAPEEASEAASGDAGAYHVGVVQLVQHPALDAATEGFQDKLTELVEDAGAECEIFFANTHPATPPPAPPS